MILTSKEDGTTQPTMTAPIIESEEMVILLLSFCCADAACVRTSLEPRTRQTKGVGVAAIDLPGLQVRHRWMQDAAGACKFQ